MVIGSEISCHKKNMWQVSPHLSILVNIGKDADVDTSAVWSLCLAFLCEVKSVYSTDESQTDL